MPNSLHRLPTSANILRTELPNGIVVLAYQKPDVQSVVITGSLAVGAAYHHDTALGGLAAFVAEMLTRGTQHRSFDAFHTALEDIGADLSIGGGRYRTEVSGRALSEDLPTLMMLLEDVLKYPLFDPSQVERLRGEMLTALNYYEQDTRHQAGRAFAEALYPPDHLHHPNVEGTLESNANLQLSDLTAFHAQHYGARGMVLAVVGNVEPARATDIVASYLGDWHNPNQPAPIAPALPPVIDASKRVHRPIHGKTQLDLKLGFVGPSRNAEDYYATMLVNSVLGQFGMMGRIGDIVREEKGMAYYCSSSIEGGYGPGAWSASAGVSPENAQEATQDILHEFTRIITEQVTEEELDDVKAYYTGHLPLQLESNQGVASLLLRIENFGLGLDYLLGYEASIMAHTREQLLAAAQHYIQPEKVVVASAGTVAASE
ncbi:MAG: M16 family metallopeptidase [Phototrophicaceae bacterium]